MNSFFKISNSFLLFFIYLFPFISNYNFIYPKNSQILYITDIQACQFYGEIEIIEGSFQIYCFSSSYIQQDEYGNFKNHVKLYEPKKGEKQSIDSNKKYLIIIGIGYIAFNSNSNEIIYLDKLLNVYLPYDLNQRLYELNGLGNKLEVSVNNAAVSVYISNNNNFCNGKCSFDVNGEEIIKIINLKNAKNALIKFLYVQRNETYDINKNTGNVIKYLIKQQFKFVISDSLGKEYYNSQEGIIDISGNVNANFENVLSYEKRQKSTNNYLYYIQPSNKKFSVVLETISDDGEISVVGKNPTIIINFPKTMNYNIKVTYPPQYVRFIIDESFDDNYYFSFENNVNWIKGKMFNESGEFNGGESLSLVNITKIDAGKTFTAIFNYTGNFLAKKALYWIQIHEYEVKYFTLNNGEEIAFKYNDYSKSNVTFENGYFGNNVEIYIYENENNIKYDLVTKNFSGFSEIYTSWKELSIDLKINNNNNKNFIYLIIKAKEVYSDYISFRTNYLLLNNDIPQTYEKFYDLNYITYSLTLEEGENVIEILTNAQDNQLTISLYQNENEKYICTKKACHFRHIQNSENIYYNIYIKNIENKVEKTTKLYIFQYRINEYYLFGNMFFTKNFLSSFEYKFKLYDTFIPILNSTKELVINYQPPSNSELYNITISSNIMIESKMITEKISNKIYRHYYYNLININNISEIIITIKGDISDNLFLPPEKVGLSFGGPFSYKCPQETVNKKSNSIVGNLIYFRIQNFNTQNDYIVSIPERAKIIEGKIFNENGELNNKCIKMKKYITINKLFNNSDIITIEYNRIDAEIYYEHFYGETIEIYDYRQLNYYELDFSKSNRIYYFGFYNNKIENATAYIENPDKNITIYYQNKFDLSKIIPNDYLLQIKTEFFSLNREFDIIEFYGYSSKMNKKKRDFIIYDPKKTVEEINYMENRKYIILKNSPKTFGYITSGEEEDNFKILIISKSNTIVKLNFDFFYDSIILNKTNRYTMLFEITKYYSFKFHANSVSDSILFIKVFKESVFKRLIIYNNTSINETANNILFQIFSLKNTSNIIIEIKNPQRKIFYWNFYKINKSYNIENQLKKIILPILAKDRNEQNFKNTDIVNIQLNNPFYNLNESYYNYYFALSYEQDFENPVETNYEIKIKYNVRNQSHYLEQNKFIYLDNVYNSKHSIKPYLELIFLNYQPDLDINIFVYLEDNSKLELKKGSFYQKYNQFVLYNPYSNNNIDYEIQFKSNINQNINNTCAFLLYRFLNEKINLNYLNDFNNYWNINIKVNKTKILWKKINNISYYDIYIFKNATNLPNLNNYCYLKSLNNITNPDLKIIRTTDNFYEFPKKTQHLLINIIGLESNYNINVVYSYVKYDYEYNENEESKALLFIFISSGVVAFIIIIVIIICCCKKKKEQQNSDFGISMSQDPITLGINNHNENETLNANDIPYPKNSPYFNNMPNSSDTKF